MSRALYLAAGVGVLAVAGWLIAGALQGSLVYFVTPSEYAAAEEEYTGRRLRLGGIVQEGSVAFDRDSLQLTFLVTDTIDSYPVRHRGAPPELFKENTGVVVEGRFDEGTFVSDQVLVKHSEVYQAPAEGQAVDVDALKESLQ